MSISFKSIVSLCIIGVFVSLSLSSCEPEGSSSPYCTMWFYGSGKYGIPTIKVDGKMVGKLTKFIINPSEINCNSTLGLPHKVKPGTYYVEILDDLLKPIKGGNVTVKEKGKCYPIRVD